MEQKGDCGIRDIRAPRGLFRLECIGRVLSGSLILIPHIQQDFIETRFRQEESQ